MGANSKDGANLTGLILARRRRRSTVDLLVKSTPNDAAPVVFGDWLFDAAAVGGDVSGTLATTLGGITFAGSGLVTETGMLSSTLGSIVVAASGQVKLTSTLATTLGSVTFAGSGTETISGSLSATLGGITFVGSGSVASAGADGSLSFTTGSVVFAGQGTETLSGSLSTSLAGITFAGSGLETIAGSLSSTLAGIAFDGNGLITESGTLAFTTDSILFSGQGNIVTNDVNGTLGFTTDGIGFSAIGTTDESIPQQIGGGGYFDFNQKKLRKKLEYDEQKAKEAYEEILESAPIEVKKQAIAIVKPFSETNKKTPAPESIDWIALEHEKIRVNALLALWQEQIEINNEDDEILLLM